jgi:hypothetical protein
MNNTQSSPEARRSLQERSRIDGDSGLVRGGTI